MKKIKIKNTNSLSKYLDELKDIVDAHHGEQFSFDFEGDENINQIGYAYIQGREDEKAYKQEKEEPAKSLYEWKLYITPIRYQLWSSETESKTYLGENNKLLFEIFPGDYGGYFACCKDKPELTTEADDLDELKENIITLVRNWNEEE